MSTKLFIGADHAGFQVKQEILQFLQDFFKRENFDVEIVDVGPDSDDRVDYPDYAAKLCLEMKNDLENSKGILVCGSGIGMSMMANRFSYIRAALCMTTEEGKLSREHNDSNVLCLGARTNNLENIKEIIEAWLKTEFSGGRHGGRVQKLSSRGDS